MKNGLVWVAGVVAGLAVSAVGRADPRPWTFVEDTYPEGTGRLEYEQWVTYSAQKGEDKGFSRFDFRHQFEFGVTEKLDVSLFVADWHYEDSDEGSRTRFDDVAVEGIYYFSDPRRDPVGLGVFAEVGFGQSGVEVCSKLIVHKDFAHWAVSYNLIVEAMFENAYNAEEAAESDGAIGHAVGASYAIDHNWRLGAEGIVETALPRWSEQGETSVYVGPNFGYVRHLEETGGEFWMTVTPMFQLTNEEEEPDFQIRMIATWLF